LTPFWRTKTLEEMTAAEWESLCDGCGRCCLHKLEEWDEAGGKGDLHFTSIACRLLDPATCRCSDYAGRFEAGVECVALDAALVRSVDWLPPSCAYRLVAEGRDLYWWHPLVSGDPESVHAAGVSARGRVVSETEVPEAEWEDYIVAWPGEMPPQSRRPRFRKP